MRLIRDRFPFGPARRVDALAQFGEIRLGETGRVLVAGGVPGASLPAYLYFEDGKDTPEDVPGRGAMFVADLGPLLRSLRWTASSTCC